jgi:sulfur carrier protein
MKLRINGQDRDFPELQSNPSLAHLISLLEMQTDRVAVERNGEIASRSGWSATILLEGDKLEIVQFVGGGSARPSHSPPTASK